MFTIPTKYLPNELYILLTFITVVNDIINGI